MRGKNIYIYIYIYTHTTKIKKYYSRLLRRSAVNKMGLFYCAIPKPTRSILSECDEWERWRWECWSSGSCADSSTLCRRSLCLQWWRRASARSSRNCWLSVAWWGCEVRWEGTRLWRTDTRQRGRSTPSVPPGRDPAVNTPARTHCAHIDTCTGWPKKVYRYQVSSLYRIKNRH